MSLAKVLTLSLIAIALLAATATAASRPSAPTYSRKLMTACLFKHHVFTGYTVGHGATEPVTVTGEIDLHDYGFRGLRPIGDGVLVFEKSHADAVRDEAKLANVLTFPPPEYQKRIMGNVVVLLSPQRHNPALGNSVLAACFPAARQG